jgi:hypothetical protein
MAGKDIAHIKLPEPLIQSVKAAAMSDKVKGKVRDPIVAAHDLLTDCSVLALISNH